MRILYLDDDRLQLDLVRSWLEPLGHSMVACTNGNEAIKAIERDAFDLAVLDWRVPGTSGEEVLRWIRMRRHGIPVMFATSHDTEEEIVHILGLGADDYLVKPLRRLEFLARVNALARRGGAREGYGVIEAPPYRVLPDSGTVELDGRPVKMTPRMAAVAALLFRKSGELVSRGYLYEHAWGRREQLDTRTVDTHISRLRTALELDGRHGWKLVSVYQHGYRLEKVEKA
ncbi:MAG TPA: response regulator transcription factor [Usitatibacter sp.]|nr:response regulator transcription factor [Usitatibacter sp.]